MVIQTEIYPGFGYQVQQTYTALQDGYYSPNDHYGHASNDRYCQGSGKHMPTSPYITSTPVLKPSGGYGQHHDGWFDTSNPQHGSNSTTTKHYSHGSNCQIPTYNNYDASKYNGGYSNNHEMGYSGYGTYHGMKAPMGVNTLESIKYEYEYSSSAKPTIDHNSNGMQSGYRRVWEIKNVDD